MRLPAFLLLILSLSPLHAQVNEKKTTISFEYYTHDFGVIKEDGGLVTYEFEFVNAGNIPLIIKNVQASCGCTVPTWTKETIAPQNKGRIKVEFDPNNKPGPFNKSLVVYSNSTNDGTMLTIMGKVVPKPRKPHDDYPDKIGNLRMMSRYMNMGDVTTDKWQKRAYDIYNQSDTIISIKNISFTGTHVNVKIEPMDMPARSKGKVIVEYSPKWKNDFGYVQDKIELQTNDKLQPVKTLYVSAHIVLAFNELTPDQKIRAPKIRFDKYTHDFGLVKQGEKSTVIFTIRNDGADDLQIMKVKPSCGCTLTELEKKTIKSGETSKLTLTFDTAGKEGMQEKHINLYTNDPDNHNIVISLKAKIVK